MQKYENNKDDSSKCRYCADTNFISTVLSNITIIVMILTKYAP